MTTLPVIYRDVGVAAMRLPFNQHSWIDTDAAFYILKRKTSLAKQIYLLSQTASNRMESARN